MNIYVTYLIIAVILVAAELLYFRIADRCNIIDKPNERSSHTSIVLRGGGVIFSLSMIVWAMLMLVQGKSIVEYLPFLCGLILIAGVSFWDDVIRVGSYRHIPYVEDYELWARAMTNGIQIANVGEVLVHARVGNGMVQRPWNKEVYQELAYP